MDPEAPLPLPQVADSGGNKGTQMGRIGRQTLIYGLGIVLSKAVAFIMLPVYTRFLTPGDYGVMELIDMTLDVVSIVAGGKIALGIFRYYHKAETKQEQDEVVSTALLTLAATYTIVAFAVLSAAPLISNLVFRNQIYAPLIRIAAGTLAFQSLLIAPLAYVRVRQQPVTFVAASLAKLSLALAFNIYFVVHLRLGAKGVLLSSLVSTAAVGSLLGMYVLRQVGLRWSSSIMRRLLRYGGPLIATQVATFIVTFGDRYFLQRAADVTAVGVYTLAYQFGFMLGTLGYMPFELVWDPMRFRIAKRDDRDDIFARAFIYLNVALISLAVLIILFIRDLLHVMTTPGFYGAAGLVPVILVAYVLQGWASMQCTGIYVNERTEFITLGTWLSAVVAVAGYFFFIPRYFGIGAAITTVIAFAVYYAVCYYSSQRLWPIRYRWSPVLRQVAIAAAVVGIGFLVPGGNIVTSIGLHGVLFALYVALLWRVVLDSKDRALVREFIAQHSNRLSRIGTKMSGVTGSSPAVDG